MRFSNREYKPKYPKFQTTNSDAEQYTRESSLSLGSIPNWTSIFILLFPRFYFIILTVETVPIIYKISAYFTFIKTVKFIYKLI
jgi:hypothetical protein